MLHDLEEDVTLDLDVGDTVLMGKFKNKKVKVNSIKWNEKGDLLINGKVATKWRMFKKAPKIDKNPFGEGVNVVKLKGKNKEDFKSQWSSGDVGEDDGDYRDYDSPESSDIEQPYKPKKQLKKNKSI